MRVLVVGIFVLALAVAGVSTYLIKTFSGESNIKKLEKEVAIKKFKVLVAKRDIRIGETITANDMMWQEWAKDALNKQFVVVDAKEQEDERKKEFVGGIVRNTIIKNEPILANKLFKRDNAGFMAGMLGPGMRAISVPVSAVTGVSGFILPGDYVDVVMSYRLNTDSRKKLKQMNRSGLKVPLVSEKVVDTILRKVRVIATDQTVEELAPNNKKKEKSKRAKTVTLEVTAKQAEILTVARTMGKISLVLRSLEDNADHTMPSSFTTDVEVSPFTRKLFSSATGRKVAPVVPIRGSSSMKTFSTTAGKRKTVKIYRGGSGVTETIGGAGGVSGGKAAK